MNLPYPNIMYSFILSQIRLSIDSLFDFKKYCRFPSIEFTHRIVCLQFIQEHIFIARLNRLRQILQINLSNEKKIILEVKYIHELMQM